MPTGVSRWRRITRTSPVASCPPARLPRSFCSPVQLSVCRRVVNRRILRARHEADARKEVPNVWLLIELAVGELSRRRKCQAVSERPVGEGVAKGGGWVLLLVARERAPAGRQWYAPAPHAPCRASTTASATTGDRSRLAGMWRYGSGFVAMAGCNGYRVASYRV